MKKCTQCNIEKEEEEFSFHNKALNKRHATCKQCVRLKDKESYTSNERKISIRKAAIVCQNRNREYVNDYKKKHSCNRCGDKRWYVLDFHHLTDKKFEVSVGIFRGLSLDKLQSEIDKCELLCANCHREEHYLNKTGAYFNG